MVALLKEHFEMIEKLLLARYDVSKNASHAVNKGTAREFFMKDFLMEHLSRLVGIGQGEIINADTHANDLRNQQDIVIYRRDFPRIRFGGEINGFLAESIIATIEVKSKLDKDDIRQAISAAYRAKNLERSFSQAYVHPDFLYPRPKIMSLVVAYDSSVKIKTVQSWLTPIHSELNIPYPEKKSFVPPADRTFWNSPSLDGIFVLGKGFVAFGDCPIIPKENLLRESGYLQITQILIYLSFSCFLLLRYTYTSLRMVLKLIPT